jgi:hypothetical protein
MEKFYLNPDSTYWGSVVDGNEPPFDGAVEVASPPDTNAAQVWNGTSWNAYVPPAPDPLDALEALITQGQIAMSEAPLPNALQKEIFNLEVFIRNYYQRGAISLVIEAIEGFVIPDGYPGVTQGQRTQVEGLKTQMLEVFGAL